MRYSYEQLEQWDKEYVWHPFTQMKTYVQEHPLIIERGSGSYLFDVNGNKYLDGYASLWVNVHGHNDPELNEALHMQIETIAHSTLLGSANVPSILLAKKLVELWPGLSKVFYSDTGAAAVEIALKIAYQYWQNIDPVRYAKKTAFVSLREAYHGDTIGAVSVGGMELYHRIFQPLLFERIEVPSPYVYRMSEYGNEQEIVQYCLQQLEHVLASEQERVAAVIVEPLVQGAAGIITHPRGFLKGVEALCRRYGVLLICDEVAVGFGRTGTMFACEQEQVTPDIVCLGKGITGGYLPLAATLTTNQVYEAFLGEADENKTFYHGHTYTGNQLSCSVALKNIELMEKRQLVENVRKKAEFLAKKLEMLYELPIVGDIRQKGLMTGIEIVQDRNTKEIFPRSEMIEHRIILEARKRGLIIRPLGPVLTFIPVLAMTEEQMETAVSILFDSIAEMAKAVR
ncbi:adenosylmethionine--8-amino-7-oxononanoate transaminase [Parageobacillus thermoglucosidasius]|uniref:Adenosylmethionine-8-amino-7-oxononanoate aminotransferase n=1 Tax=Parageobacillus thermoglucosidasius TaxID=1426 RepID=A0AAN0YLK2_PARTM|nr:adenosylmethionine--8-amino-7-oxononanoate transaminase [Parageobacillus thermoglucosidasius]ALF08635.1 adenosylmethionine-8-amino-7-oxononanoate aminotransferase [Parageobacillus thermoglucosidasius]ANZ28719.1 adenosylmethionine--8-amino-7-oxononanoate transaminase [Parageobacillus thermoglucosidasius]APM79456.1 adenosylmethionine--8-amino-7-oxononanoate transaminase [Parageobacillus thermoglucosidasius]KJX68680.1 adenosylmethionine-8-amino-7-oxononanoate aminotransferase [Parageobacillus t